MQHTRYPPEKLLLETILEKTLKYSMRNDAHANYRFDRPENIQIETAKICKAYASSGRKLYIHYELDKICGYTNRPEDKETYEKQEIIRILIEQAKAKEIGEEGLMEINLKWKGNNYANEARLKIYSEPTFNELAQKMQKAGIGTKFEKTGRYQYGGHSGYIWGTTIETGKLDLLLPLVIDYMVEKLLKN